MNQSLQQQITDLVTSNRVVLFMKGTRDAPACGFSARVVQTLNALIADYETVNVLAYPELRDGIKEFSNWPTIPQLYIDGKFIGGCDIVTDLHANSELEALLDVDSDAQSPLPERPLDLSKACRCSDRKRTA
jgi:monothiol glutaredoxin